MIRTARPPRHRPDRVGGPGAPASLADTRDLLLPALEDALSRLAPDIRRVAAYHVGLCDAEGRPVRENGGKALRPTLALVSARAVGGRPEVALPGALAVELVHDFSLLHDDVMDGDRERRHRPTAWALFGIAPAIIAGDALVTLAHQVLLEPPTAERVRASRALAEATARMIAGQARDVAFESASEVSPEECLRMSADKTGALLGCSASIGAILAGAPEDAVQALREFGLHLGLAYQAVDDLLGLWGDPAVTGKPRANDLRQRKKTLPVSAALAAGGSRASTLRELLSRTTLDDREVEAAALIEDAGGRRWTEALAEKEARRALAALDAVHLHPAARAELAQLGRFVAHRDF